MYTGAVGGINPQELKEETFNNIPCLTGGFKAKMSGIDVYYKLVFASMKSDRAVTIIFIGREVDHKANETHINAVLASLRDLQN